MLCAALIRFLGQRQETRPLCLITHTTVHYEKPLFSRRTATHSEVCVRNIWRIVVPHAIGMPAYPLKYKCRIKINLSAHQWSGF